MELGEGEAGVFFLGPAEGPGAVEDQQVAAPHVLDPEGVAGEVEVLGVEIRVLHPADELVGDVPAQELHPVFALHPEFQHVELQNADDAGATHARFELRSNELLFAHNGTRHFSISPLEREDIDTERGTLGDINSITSVANSNKKFNAIGKFGVGFKAVFHYTRTPHIAGSL